MSWPQGYGQQPRLTSWGGQIAVEPRAGGAVRWIQYFQQTFKYFPLLQAPHVRVRDDEQLQPGALAQQQQGGPRHLRPGARWGWSRAVNCPSRGVTVPDIIKANEYVMNFALHCLHKGVFVICVIYDR